MVQVCNVEVGILCQGVVHSLGFKSRHNLLFNMAASDADVWAMSLHSVGALLSAF